MARRAGQVALLIVLCQQALERMGAGDGEVIGIAQIEVRKSPSTQRIGRPSALRRAWSIMVGMASRPVTCLPLRQSGIASRPVPQPRSRTRGPQILRQVEEELAVIVDAAILGIVAGAVVIFAAAHGGDGDIFAEVIPGPDGRR